jgi:hypothetical protein
MICAPMCGQATAVPVAHPDGVVRGTVADVSGALVGGAQVALSVGTVTLKAATDDDGNFEFRAVPPGDFKLTVAEKGLVPAAVNGILHPGEVYVVPEIDMKVAATDEVDVSMTQEELAEKEVKIEEKQRLAGVLPNFYVTYDWHAQPLEPHQKFELAARSIIDPTTFAITAAVAGIQEDQHSFNGFGYGPTGYGKRYAADFGNVVFGTLLGGWALPVVFKQDPRYFYKGTGTFRERFFYALSTAVIARGDNGKWQPAYAGILGDYGAGAISNLYYPASSRQGASLTIENGTLNVLGNGIGNVVQEFILRHVTPGTHKNVQAQP